MHDRLEKFSSYIREEEGEQRTSAGSSGPARRSVVHTPRHLEEYQAPHHTIQACNLLKCVIMQGNSSNSSRSNISPFGRTPPSLLSGSPTVSSSGPPRTTALCRQVASRLEGWREGLFRHRAGSVPTRPPLERKRHRTQSEGEKDAGPP